MLLGIVGTNRDKCSVCFHAASVVLGNGPSKCIVKKAVSFGVKKFRMSIWKREKE